MSLMLDSAWLRWADPSWESGLSLQRPNHHVWNFTYPAHIQVFQEVQTELQLPMPLVLHQVRHSRTSNDVSMKRLSLGGCPSERAVELL